MVNTSIAGTSSDGYRKDIQPDKQRKKNKASLRIIRFENYHPPKSQSTLLLQAVKR